MSVLEFKLTPDEVEKANIVAAQYGITGEAYIRRLVQEVISNAIYRQAEAIPPPSDPQTHLRDLIKKAISRIP